MRAATMLTIIYLSLVILSPDMASAQDWRVVLRAKGIVGYARASGFPLDEVRAVGVVEAPLPAIEALLRDIPAEKRFGYRCAEAYRVDVPGIKTTPDSFPIYYRMQLPFPVQDRDVIWLVRFSHNPVTGILKADLRALDTNYATHPGVIRMHRGSAIFLLTPLGQDRTEIDYTAQCDPAGTLPAFLVSMILRDFAPATLAKIREVVKDTPYQSATTIATKTPLP